MDPKIEQGQLIFYNETLVGYVERVQDSDDGMRILHLRVPYVDLPPATKIRAVQGKRITIKVGSPKRELISTPSKVILDSLGRPIKVAKS